jgi:hypothetical protein
MVLPQLSQAEETSAHNYTTILDQLTRVYDNPNKVQEAEDKLLALKQGTDSLHAYMAKFERILYEARGQDWPDVNKISTFRNGLNSTLRNRLAQQLNLPRKYPDFVRIVQQLAGRSSSAVIPHPHAVSSSNLNHHSEPMELNTVTFDEMYPKPQQARSISPERRQQYRAEGRCVRCGSQDHWVKDCKKLPFSAGKPVAGHMTIAALDDDAYDNRGEEDIEEEEEMTPEEEARIAKFWAE